MFLSLSAFNPSYSKFILWKLQNQRKAYTAHLQYSDSTPPILRFPSGKLTNQHAEMCQACTMRGEDWTALARQWECWRRWVEMRRWWIRYPLCDAGTEVGDWFFERGVLATPPAIVRDAVKRQGQIAEEESTHSQEIRSTQIWIHSKYLR